MHAPHAMEPYTANGHVSFSSEHFVLAFFLHFHPIIQIYAHLFILYLLVSLHV